MSPEERKILEETYRLAKENNRQIKKIRRHMAAGTIFRVIYWVILIGTGIGLFYFMQPYIDNLISTYTGFREQVNTVNSFLGGGTGS